MGVGAKSRIWNVVSVGSPMKADEEEGAVGIGSLDLNAGIILL